MDGMQWMASAMHAARSQLETATQNLANVSSDGFRRFDSHVALTPGGLVATESRTFEQGAIRHTGRPLDLAILGPGHFDAGGSPTRSGAFVLDRDGFLSDDRGRRVRGTAGPVRMNESRTIAADGSVREGERIVNRLPLPAGSKIQTGALETSNVNAIGETLAILNAQRAFETAQKTLVAIDETRQKAMNDVARLK
ncbi:MAG: flagellar basal body rod protein FlgF [Candidatus Velthaea sp.]